MARRAAGPPRRARNERRDRARGVIHSLAALPRGDRLEHARSSCCSRTSTGPTLRCSRSSTISSTGRATCRSSCSARPGRSYTRRHPTWGGGTRNSTTVSLSPLSTAETERLVFSLLETAVLPAETSSALLERSGGNPLYAEEYVKLFLERRHGRGTADAGHRARDHRRPARHAAARAERLCSRTRP